jgi:hypothetical protein
MSFWHPSGMRCFFLLSGGVARQASRNRRLKSGKPPACPGGLGSLGDFGGLSETALPKSCRLRNISMII